MVTPKPARGRGRLQSRRARLALALGAGMMALLCLGGVGVFIALYDEATEIKRTAPDAVADSFLRAFLVNKDEKDVALYACSEGGDFSQLAAYRADILAREAQHSISIVVSWERLLVSTSGSEGTVQVDITRGISDGSEQITDGWVLRVVDQNGWRVCGAQKSG